MNNLSLGNGPGEGVRSEERIYIQGRVYAKTKTEALEMIETVITKKGYAITRPPNIRPAFTQHIKGVIWWEYIARIEEVQHDYLGNTPRVL